MKLPFQMPEMKTGLVVSGIAHVAFLIWGIVSFSAKPLEAKPTDSLPVDIISTTQFSELTKGVKTGKQDATNKQQVEKVGDPKPVDDTAAKPTEKKEIKTAAAEPTPPALDQQKVEPPKPDKKPPPKDEIAEALKKEQIKKKQIKKKQEEQKQKAAEKKQQQQPKFDPNQIAALLDKRDPTRQTLTGEAIAPAPPSLGMPSANPAVAKLSQSELDAMRRRLMQLWNPPAGVQNPEQLVVKIRVQLGRDGKLNGPPLVLTSGRGALFEAARDNAIRALARGQPFEMLSKDTYDLWKEIEITFDPRDMNRG